MPRPYRSAWAKVERIVIQVWSPTRKQGYDPLLARRACKSRQNLRPGGEFDFVARWQIGENVDGVVELAGRLGTHGHGQNVNVSAFLFAVAHAHLTVGA